MGKEDGALTGVIDEMKAATSDTDGDKVRVGRLIDALEHRGYGPALALLPLIELTPLGGVPGVPTLLAMTLGLLTVRLLLGYKHFWIPDWLRRQTVGTHKVIKSLEWLTPLTHRIDAKLHQRLSRFAGASARRVAGIVILCLLLAVPPLEFVPFATSGPMIVISIFGLAILFRDGLLMVIGFCGAVVALGAGVWPILGW